ncbi:hypothetical protein ABZ307_07790 [Streptomyces griseorubiginosus]
MLTASARLASYLVFNAAQVPDAVIDRRLSRLPVPTEETVPALR